MELNLKARAKINLSLEIIGKREDGYHDLSMIMQSIDIYDTINWRFIQHLWDIRNLCDHKKQRDPSNDEIEELINGTDKVIKTIFW